MRYVDGAGNVVYPYDEDFAARATDYLFDYVEAHPERIARVYYYAWRNRAPNDDAFDTALLRRDGSKRPTYDVVASRLATLLPGVATAPPVAARAPARKLRRVRLLDRPLAAYATGLLAGPLRCSTDIEGTLQRSPRAALGRAPRAVRHTAIFAARGEQVRVRGSASARGRGEGLPARPRAAGSRSSCDSPDPPRSRAHIGDCRWSSAARDPPPGPAVSGRRVGPRPRRKFSVGIPARP